MTKSTFLDSLSSSSPSDSFNPYYTALWYIFKNDWQSAHPIVDGPPGETYAWLHAIVHRMEGDRWNANYWYGRAGKTYPDLSIEEERELILESLLEGK